MRQTPFLSARTALAAGILVATTSCISPIALMAPLWTKARPAPLRIERPVLPEARLAVSFIGHATVLLQIDDKLVLTDPVLTRTAGQVSARIVEPGISTERVPALSAVLISHMHFDHLSLGTLEMLEERVGSLLLPKPGLVYLTDFRFPATELEPWDSWHDGALQITATPVRHRGWRYGMDSWMRAARTGYVIEHGGVRVYFAGDTAYDAEDFVETRRRFPNIELAILPIAPIEPREYMRVMHMDPEEAVQAMTDLGAARMLAVHFDTFVNGNDREGDAPRALREAARRRGLDDHRVLVLRVGEQQVILSR